MNPKIQCRRILGVFAIAFVISILSFISVQAKNTSKSSGKVECENYLTNIKFLKRYNATLIEDPENPGANKFILSINPESADKDLEAKLKDVVFKVVKINDSVQNGSIKVSYDNPVTLNGLFVKNKDFEDEMSVTLESCCMIIVYEFELL